MAELLAALDNLWFLLDVIEGVIFLSLAVYFTVNPGKATFLISNFSHLPKAQRESYDLRGLSRYLCRVFTLCAALCIAGGVAAIWLEGYAYWASTLLWIVVALATLRMDNEKLLKKYRKD